ncbi:aminopeptidase N [Microbacterium gorillae]|uniref:aminopeptidase N n=1 Tax=Microbacterium gorillae TaxID=1231063 RepID=UPI0006934ACD|nr:aminopeptidase N [Microbacterium gorillae]
MSLTLQEARVRADLIREVDTVVHLDLRPEDRFVLDATVTFACSSPGASSFLELTGAEDVEITTSGDTTATYDGARIALTDLAAQNSVTVRATMPYVTDGDGMTVVTDPADGERYVSAYTAMDVAQKVIPCFDQPDLKSSFTVSVTAPSHWTVLANGRLDRREGDTWHFRKTPRFSSYIFFLCGGPYVSITWDEPYAGGTLPFGWHARASQEPELRREIDGLKATTSAAFAYYTSTFTEPYPFEDYQQVFTPGLNWGAMEFPGCVAFRDEYLTPAPPTAMQRHAMSSVIAHEMAHMWFGDLVTFRWWEDSWLNESFADYMGYEVGGRATGSSLWTAAALGRKPTAYRADARRSTHPIAEDAENLPDVDTAFANFDMITYAKGNAVLRQLVTWLGEEDFFTGVNAHLSAHPFGNATLADFLDALDSATDRDVRSWAASWLRTTGYDTIRVTRDGDVPVLVRDGSRPHRFTVTGYDDRGAVVREALVDLADGPIRLDEFAGLAVLPNSADETYAALDMDAVSRRVLDRALGAVASPLTRALLWATAVADVEHGRRNVGSVVDLARTQLAVENDPTVLEGAIALVLRVTISHSSTAEIGARLAALADLATVILDGGNPELAPAAERLFAHVGADVEVLQERLRTTTDQAVRWMIVRRLAELGRPDLIATEADRDRTTSGAHAALSAGAAVGTPDAKAQWWTRLISGELSNREFSAVAAGFWGIEQGALVAEWVARAPGDLADLARRSGQAMGQLIGRALPTIPTPDDGAALVSALRSTIDGGLPTVAARGFNDLLDDAERARATRIQTNS